VAQIEAAGGVVQYDRELEPGLRKPPGPNWLHQWLGEHAFDQVIQVYGWGPHDDGLRCTDHELKLIGELPAIEYLSLIGSDITDDGMQHVARLANLRELSLVHTSITPSGMAQLAKLDKLETLMLAGEWVTDECTLAISELPNLQQLTLARTPNVSAAGFANLKGLTNLRELHVYETPAIGDDAVACLRDFKSANRISSLALADTAVSDAGLVHLGLLPALEHLDLSNTQVSDAGLKELAKITGLQRLDIWPSQVTDRGVLDLAPLRELKKLEVGPYVTVEGEERLGTLLPNCYINDVLRGRPHD
jgi:hypothetical protein